MRYLLLLLLPLLAGDTNYKVKSAAVTFKVKNAGMTVDGSFSGLLAEIRFDPLKLADSHIRASVSSTTVSTGNSMRDGHLRKAEYFDCSSYPLITMESVKFEKTGPISFNGTFRLTLKNVTHEVVVPFNFIKIPEKTEFRGSFTINRLDYGVGSSSLTLGDNVTISLSILVAE